MNRIREIRKSKKMSQKEIAIDLKFSQASISEWEIGKSNPSTANAMKLAEYFGVPLDYLMGLSDDDGQNKNAPIDFGAISNIIPIEFGNPIPILGDIACGEPILAEENIQDYIRPDKSITADFALVCHGDSMINARIFDGDIVFIRQQPDVENGEIAAVLIENEATLKRVYKYKNSIELRPENPTFPVLDFEGEKLNSIKILGKAVAFISAIR